VGTHLPFEAPLSGIPRRIGVALITEDMSCFASPGWVLAAGRATHGDARAAAVYRPPGPSVKKSCGSVVV
jgi:hypothetical protein